MKPPANWPEIAAALIAAGRPKVGREVDYQIALEYYYHFLLRVKSNPADSKPPPGNHGRGSTVDLPHESPDAS